MPSSITVSGPKTKPADAPSAISPHNDRVQRSLSVLAYMVPWHHAAGLSQIATEHEDQ